MLRYRKTSNSHLSPAKKRFKENTSPLRYDNTYQHHHQQHQPVKRSKVEAAYGSVNELYKDQQQQHKMPCIAVNSGRSSSAHSIIVISDCEDDACTSHE